MRLPGASYLANPSTFISAISLDRLDAMLISETSPCSMLHSRNTFRFKGSTAYEGSCTLLVLSRTEIGVSFEASPIDSVLEVMTFRGFFSLSGMHSRRHHPFTPNRKGPVLASSSRRKLASVTRTRPLPLPLDSSARGSHICDPCASSSVLQRRGDPIMDGPMARNGKRSFSPNSCFRAGISSAFLSESFFMRRVATVSAEGFLPGRPR
mmetsp:Transcript_10380/g.17813  ORF Transcript_10380/g.17813 Transcript_10380/m.17813 type:complete len:209 (-) Transcript_10380:746-1372(-)